MTNRRSVFFPFLALLVFVISVGCLCTGLTNKVTETPTATQPPVQLPTARPTQPPAQPTEAPVTEAPVSNNNNSSGGLTTFTDENNYFAIDVPSDWTYQHTVSDDKVVYIDTFTSPDGGGAYIESIVYDDGKPFTGNDKSTFALYFLNKWYSKTGKEGDIRISEDKIMQDGSERLIWTSKGGNYSGISFLETRGKTTFLFFTVDWGNSVKDQYMDTLNAVIESYRVP